MQPECPICGSTQFGDFRGRVAARCSGCGGFERSRLLWMVIAALDVRIDEARPFLHVAPEVGIGRQLEKRWGAGYRALDYDPEIYAKNRLKVERIDLCNDLKGMPTGSVGALCHVHVLEHVRCNATLVLQQINRVVAPGGYHLFSVPFASRQYKEDLSGELTKEQRLAQFGHEDHVRSFGSQDFEVMFAGAFEGMERIALESLVSQEALARANVPARALSPHNSHGVAVYRKPPG